MPLVVWRNSHLNDEQRWRFVRVYVVSGSCTADHAPTEDRDDEMVARIMKELVGPAFIDWQVEDLRICRKQQGGIAGAEQSDGIR
jgi:hypothetical protein